MHGNGTAKPALKNLKSLPYGGASYVDNPEMDNVLLDILQRVTTDQVTNDLGIKDKFLERYVEWIKSTELNALKGLDNFKVSAYSSGTSESFDKFYLKNHNRRFRCFKGEYMYHQVAWRNYFPDWKFIDEEPLAANDAVVISLPFSDTGNPHNEMHVVLNECDRLGIPVLIDMAYFGICHDIIVNLDRPCITDVVFSLSKCFPVSHLRIGMRLTRTDDDDTLLVHHKTNYINRLGAGVGLALLDKFGPDWNYEQYSQNQRIFCNTLQLLESNTVIFGIDEGVRSEYNRGNDTNRLNLSKYLHSGALPTEHYSA